MREYRKSRCVLKKRLRAKLIKIKEIVSRIEKKSVRPLTYYEKKIKRSAVVVVSVVVVGGRSWYTRVKRVFRTHNLVIVCSCSWRCISLPVPPPPVPPPNLLLLLLCPGALLPCGVIRPTRILEQLITPK